MKKLESIRKENLELEKSLFSENEILLTDIVLYLHSSDLIEYEIEVVRKDLIGMALEAQLNGESFSSTIGVDYKEFCNELIEIGDRKSPAKKMIDYLYTITLVTGFMFVVEIISYFLKYSEYKNILLEFKMPLTWGFIISTIFFIIIGYGLIEFIAKYSFEISDHKSKKFMYLFGIIFMTIFSLAGTVKILLKDLIVMNVNYIYLLIILIIINISIMMLNKSLNKKTM